VLVFFTAFSCRCLWYSSIKYYRGIKFDKVSQGSIQEKVEFIKEYEPFDSSQESNMIFTSRYQSMIYDLISQNRSLALEELKKCVDNEKKEVSNRCCI